MDNETKQQPQDGCRIDRVEWQGIDHGTGNPRTWSVEVEVPADSPTGVPRLQSGIPYRAVEDDYPGEDFMVETLARNKDGAPTQQRILPVAGRGEDPVIRLPSLLCEESDPLGLRDLEPLHAEPGEIARRMVKARYPQGDKDAKALYGRLLRAILDALHPLTWGDALFGGRVVGALPVELTPAERLIAGRHAAAQEQAAKATKLKSKTTGEVSYKNNVIGAFAEMAVAKLTQNYWVGNLNTFKAMPDVGPYEVRGTKYSSGKLEMGDKDPEDRPYILVTVPINKEWDAGKNSPDALYNGAPVVRGWLMGSEAKKLGTYESTGYTPAYWVEQKQLHDIGKLPRLQGHMSEQLDKHLRVLLEGQAEAARARQQAFDEI